MDSIVVIMEAEKDTKNMRLFNEVSGAENLSSEGKALRVQYVNLQALKHIRDPRKIRVTIEPIE